MVKQKRINPVAKFAQRLNRCAAFTDRKKRAKQGYVKHKRAEVLTSALCFWGSVFLLEPLPSGISE